jgi:hypothetical protein
MTAMSLRDVGIDRVIVLNEEMKLYFYPRWGARIATILFILTAPGVFVRLGFMSRPFGSHDINHYLLIISLSMALFIVRDIAKRSSIITYFRHPSSGFGASFIIKSFLRTIMNSLHLLIIICLFSWVGTGGLPAGLGVGLGGGVVYLLICWALSADIHYRTYRHISLLKDS